MGEDKEKIHSFSNAAFEEAQMESESDLSKKYARKSNRKALYVLGVCFILTASLGVGIGIGFVIGEDSATGGGSFEPIIDPTEGHQTTAHSTTTTERIVEPTEGNTVTAKHQTTNHHTTERRPTGPTGPTGPSPPKDWVDMPCKDSGPRCPAGISSPPLLLISLDGLRADFMSRGVTPVLSRMAECGVSTPYMIPSFPTLTFPNHYSIATGLYPESHGIVGNTIYDENGNQFSLGNDQSLDKKWWGGEPIWNTARWQGKRSATFFWPGSEVNIQGIRPNYFNKYDGELNYRQRLDTVLGWLRLPDGYRPDVVTLYFDEPDHTGHDPGPNTDKQNEVLAQMDGLMRRLMDGLMSMDMLDCVNIIALADHGMANRTCDQTFILNDYMTSGDYRIVSTAGTMLRMLPEDGATYSDPDEVVEQLLCQHEVAVPYKKADLPKRWHYANNDRIEPIEVTVPEQWTASGGSTTFCDGGMHGYDNLGNLMKAMFIGIGPAFKSQVEVEPFQNIELYNMMCELLDLDPAPNNGTMGSLHHLLRSPKPVSDVNPTPAPEMECSFPSTDSDYNNRLSGDTSQCSCNLTDVKMYDEQLDLTPQEVVSAMGRHTPLGAPVMTFNMDYCLLTQNDYVIGYSHELRTPLWTSFRLQRPQSVDSSPVTPGCSARPDVRIPPESSASCSNYTSVPNLDIGYLFSPALSSSAERRLDAQISSNIVPQYAGFIEDVWEGFLVPHLATWADISNDISVVTGPIFDFNYDGLRDNNDTLDRDGFIFDVSGTLLPTHYFVVVTRCKGGSPLNSACAELESASFVLRNTDGIKTCQSKADYVEHHLATIRDIERLTGLHLFPDVPMYESIHLKLYAPTKGNLWAYWPLMAHL